MDTCGCGEWAPNGERIDDSDQVDRLVSEPSNLFTVRPDGTGIRYLTDYRFRSPDVVVGAGTYSPNGRWVLFKYANNVTGRYVLYKIRPNGTHQTRIRRFKVNFYGRDWGPRAS
jgi:hypothetical protein